MEEEICTIELNLDDDFASSCAYHVDYLKQTIKRNIQDAENEHKTERWVLVGMGYSLEEALDKCEKLQRMLCEKHKLKPLNLNLI